MPAPPPPPAMPCALSACFPSSCLLCCCLLSFAFYLPPLPHHPPLPCALSCLLFPSLPCQPPVPAVPCPALSRFDPSIDGCLSGRHDDRADGSGDRHLERGARGGGGGFPDPGPRSADRLVFDGGVEARQGGRPGGFRRRQLQLRECCCVPPHHVHVVSSLVVFTRPVGVSLVNFAFHSSCRHVPKYASTQVALGKCHDELHNNGYFLRSLGRELTGKCAPIMQAAVPPRLRKKERAGWAGETPTQGLHSHTRTIVCSSSRVWLWLLAAV